MKPSNWANAESRASSPRHVRERAPLTIYVLGQKLVPEPLVLEALANRPDVGKVIYIPVGQEPVSHQRNFERYVRDYNQWVADYSGQINQNNQDIIAGRKVEIQKPKRYAEQPAHNHWKMRGYDITALLQRHGGPAFSPQQITARIQEYIQQSNGVPVPTRGADIVLNMSLNYFSDYYARRDPKPYHTNHARNAERLNLKTSLPDVLKMAGSCDALPIGPRMKTIKTPYDIEWFMYDNDLQQCVIKTDRNSGGRGVFRVFRDAQDHCMVEIPERIILDSADVQPARIERLDVRRANLGQFSDVLSGLTPKQVLAVEWLEPSKGDVRLVVFNGKVMGGYIRHAKEGSWLCNCSQGGSYEPFDWKNEFSSNDQAKVYTVARMLERKGVTRVSLDFMADKNGEWFLSEINSGITRDVNGVHQHTAAERAGRGELSVADQIAQDLITRYRDQQATARTGAGR
jgi:hypothetical protein